MRNIIVPIIALAITMLVAFSFQSKAVAQSSTNKNIAALTSSLSDKTWSIPANAEEQEAAQAHSDSNSLSPILFFVIAIFIGLGFKSISDKNPLPYTITLLLCGILLGILTRTNVFSSLGLNVIASSITRAGNINPHLILYLFLPTLIFEAAYALHLHTFKKMLPNVLILSIPGVMVAIAITAFFVMYLSSLGMGLNGWTWPTALLFGAIVSATDPVAVVAILKEVGASKKLSTITEGESMLNDGTAIVFFMAIFAVVVGEGGDGNAVWEFFRVSLGGVLVGVAIGWLVVLWLKHILNDALIEISLVIGAAYLSFFVAEYFIHVSGVLSVVAFGLMMAGPGKTRTNPRNTQFLHSFWELAAFLANTMIFIIVGVVIAQQISFSAQDILALIAIFIGLHVARFGTVYLFYPIMKHLGYGLNLKDSVVLWWSGLRGAVGLSLALIVAIEPKIPIEIRSHVLSLTAGIVVLTSLINATTIKWLINKLGLSKVGTIKTHLMHQSLKQIKMGGEKEIGKLKDSRFMGEANWDKVADYLVNPDEIVTEVTASINVEDSLEECRKRLLQKEKESYWRQFSNGLLSSDGVNLLSDQIETLVDYSGQIPLSARKDIETLWQTPRLISMLYRVPFVGHFWRRSFFNQLALGFDCARAFVTAQEENLKSLSGLLITLSAENPNADVSFISTLEDELNENKITGLTFLRNLKDTYPDICRAIETQLASRSLLNQQQETVERLKKQGRLEPEECSRIETSLYSDMKRLLNTTLTVDFKSEVDAAFCKSVAFSKLPDDKKRIVFEVMQEMVFPAQTRISKEDAPFDGIFFIVNGSARIEKDGRLICIIEQGDMLGAYEHFLGSNNIYTLVSESPLSILKINPNIISELKQHLEGFDRVLFHASSVELAMYILRQNKPYSEYSSKKIRSLLNESYIVTSKGDEKEHLEGSVCILISGEASAEDSEYIIKAPALLPDCNIRSMGKAEILVLP